MKTVERNLARKLRREDGLPIKAIAARVGVAPSTVSVWTRDIELTAAQHAALRDLNPRYNPDRRGRGGRAASARRVREAAQQAGRDLAQSGDALHRMGCLLHWAEGSKSRNMARLTNSDPDLLSLYVRFLRECYEVPVERITLSGSFHLGNGLTIEEIQAYWLQALDLPAASWRKPSIVAASADELKRGRLPYGTLSVTSARSSSSRASTGRSRSTAASTGRNGSTERAARPLRKPHVRHTTGSGSPEMIDPRTADSHPTAVSPDGAVCRPSPAHLSPGEVFRKGRRPGRQGLVEAAAHLSPSRSRYDIRPENRRRVAG